MCGLFGNLATNPSANHAARKLRLLDAQAALQNRGPDDRGMEFFIVERDYQLPPFELALGHTRLAIIDLSPGGHQPMHSADSRFTIVFNGEIYNYRELRKELQTLGHTFRSDSDTEVLLAHWSQFGVTGLRQLVGMFAFVVYDRADQSLTLVRDAFGIKPIFFNHDDTGFSFASEIPALRCLLHSKPALNLQRAYDYLVHGSYDVSADTFYQGIHHLLPGHWLRVDLKRLQLGEPQRWWWPSIKERTDLSFDDAAAELRQMFLRAVRLHLRSDVPVGAALSGGLDSSAVVCAMRHLEPDMPIHTFSYVARGSSVDEESWVDIVNAHVGAIAHKVFIHPRELADELDDLVRAQGEPFTSTSIYAQYRVFKAARAAGIVVTLDGQGADEMLAGYNGYPDCFLRSRLEQVRLLEAFQFLHAWAQWPGRGWKRALLMFVAAVTPQSLRSWARQTIGHDPAPSWLDVQLLEDHGVKLDFPQQASRSPDARGRRLAEQLRFALTGKGLVSLLRHGDRNSMRWSVESRVPFLTIEMAEFLLTLPEDYILSPKGETKRIFRAAMRGLVPDAILDRRDKIGFDTPEADWLRSSSVPVNNWFSAAEKLPFARPSHGHTNVRQVLEADKAIASGSGVWRRINYARWAADG